MPDHTAAEIRRRTKGVGRKRKMSKMPKPGKAARSHNPGHGRKKKKGITAGMMF